MLSASTIVLLQVPKHIRVLLYLAQVPVLRCLQLSTGQRLSSLFVTDHKGIGGPTMKSDYICEATNL